jgi:flagellar motor switch protein FliM
MSMKVEEANGALEQSVPGVRLDLGEVEVRLSDIVSLRPGTVLDLGGAKLERCYVRIGSTVLAEGRFDTHEGKLTLTIESVV